jgi:hypothetical protein
MEGRKEFMKRNLGLISLLAAGTLIFAACDDPAMDTTTTDPAMPGQTVTEPGFQDPVVTDPVADPVATDPVATDDVQTADDALYGDEQVAEDGVVIDETEAAVVDDANVEVARQDALETLENVQATIEEEQDFDTAANTVEEVRENLAEAYQDAPEGLQAEWEMLEEQFNTLQQQLEQESMEAVNTIEVLRAQLETASATSMN